MTDVITSVGVVIGVGAVALTGWRPLDPIIAILVALNIVVTGVRLIRRSGGGLMDRSLPASERRAVDDALKPHRAEGVEFGDLQTRRAGRRSFVSMSVRVPGTWTVERGHELLKKIEADIRDALPGTSVSTHLEPRSDLTPAAGSDQQPHR